MMNLYERIRPILQRTYGKSPMVDALAEHLEEEISNYPNGVRGGSRDLPTTVMLICWDWFSGGTTAEAVAQEIMEAVHE